MSARIFRSAALVVGASALALSVMAPANAAPSLAPSVTVAECDAAKTASMDAAKTVFHTAKDAAIVAMQATNGSHKAAAAAKKVAFKTALANRKAAFVAARTVHTACIATATP